MKKVKVLQVMGGIAPEGIGTFVLNAYENIDKGLIDINFALATKYTQYYEDRILNNGAKVYRTAEIGDGIKGKINHFFNLVRVLKNEGPFDVVHTHMDFFNGINLLAAYIAKVPVRISHAHLSVNSINISKTKAVYNYVMKFLINKFSTYKIGCSKNANLYINSVLQEDNDKTKIINNGIDLERFKRKSKYNIEDIKIDSNKINFITIGRIEDPKNPVFIVEILNELIKIRKDIHLYWVGTGTMEDEVKKYIHEYNIEEFITFLGIRNDTEKLLSNVDFMIFPSIYEGLGIVLIEAQACEVPCFISNTIPLEADCGLCTIMSLDNNAKDWAKDIDKYINDCSYNNVLNRYKIEKFSVKNTASELEKIYTSNFI